MKSSTMIQSLTALTASMFLFANVASAHSEHDHSTLSLQWKFHKKIEAKIQDRGTLQGNGYYIGLSSHEQKTMKRYGIQPGNIFTTHLDGVNAYVKRTSTGMQIVNKGAMNIAVLEQLPIRKLNSISRISTGSTHSGHDHALTPYEWSFGKSTQDRIADRLNTKGEAFVGLTKFEQDVLNKYDIEVGNQFHTVIKGQTMMAERTTGGLKVIGASHNEVAQMHTNQSSM